MWFCGYMCVPLEAYILENIVVGLVHYLKVLTGD